MTPLSERFWPKVEKTEGCWNWTAFIGNNGYGYIQQGGGTRNKPLLAHRVSWELTNGPVPDGLQLDHLCRNRRCVNPSHLEPVTNLENQRRGMRATQTHCKRGHSLDDHLISNGRRSCRICKQLRAKSFRNTGRWSI